MSSEKTTYLKNSSADLRTDVKLLKSNSRKMASFPVDSLRSLMAASALLLERDPIYTVALCSSNAWEKEIKLFFAGRHNKCQRIAWQSLFQHQHFHLWRARKHCSKPLWFSLRNAVIVPVTIATRPVKSGIWSVENFDFGGKVWLGRVRRVANEIPIIMRRRCVDSWTRKDREVVQGEGACQNMLLNTP